MARSLLRAATAGVLAFLYTPILIIALYAFNAERIQVWPIREFSTEWFGSAWGNPSVRAALGLSVQVGLLSSLLAIILGSLAAFAVHRFRFFGREVFSLALVLPIALPGIVTGLALNASARTAGISFSTFTIVLGHATFCIVVVYNNVVARLRRSSGSIIEASMDLGASAWQTFRLVTLPNIATALVAGGLLAFALSFDEVIVTVFTAGSQETLPLFIFNNIKLPRNRPIVNVVAVLVMVLSLVPVYLAQRLSRETRGSVAARTSPPSMSAP